MAARAAHLTRLARLGSFFLLLLMGLLPGAARAQAPAWAEATTGSLTQPNGTSQTRAVATDASGNVFVTGNFTGAVAFGSTLLTSRGANDLFVAKYVPATGTWAWAQSGGGTGADLGYGVAVSGGSVYVTGQLQNNTANGSGVLFGGTGTTQVNGATGTNSADLVLAKYTDNGTSATLGWTQVGGGTNTDIGQGVAVSGGSVYVTGQLTNSTANGSGVLFGGTGTTAGTTQVNGASATSTSQDLVLAKYTDNGTTATLGWTQVGGGTSADIGNGVAVSGGSVYVTGYISNNTGNTSGVLFGGTGTTAGTTQVNGASSSNGFDLVLAKYTDNGPSATLGWTQVGGGTGNDLGYGVAVSGQNVLAAGYVTPAASFGSYTIAGPAGVSTSVLARLVDPTLAPLLPTISSFSPTSGVAGTPVTLTGTNLTGATSVRVNGVAVTPTNVSATSLTFVVPAGASATQSITVTTPGGTSPASSAFTVQLAVVATGTSPAPNAVAAPLASSALAVGFTEPVSAASAAGIRVFSAQAGGLKAGTVTSSGSTASYTSSLGAALRDFRAGETVSVSVPATVLGAGGLALSAPFVYQFTTATVAGPGTFAGRTDFGAGTAPYGVALGDVSGDGILDMVVVNDGSASASVLLGTGTGSFGPKTDYPTGTNPEVVVLGDVNGDGKLDLVTANYGSSNVSLLLNSGTGSFGTRTDYATGAGTRSVSLGDVNGDGALDIVTANYGGSNASVLLNMGTGSFGTHNDYAAGSNPAGVALGDVDGDGRLDLVVANLSSSNLSVWLGTGTGTFGTRTDYATGLNPVGVALGDVNGDGKLDLAVANLGTGTNSVSVLLNAGAGSFGGHTDFATGDGPISVALGDVNGDGKLDLATANYRNANATVLLGTGTGSFDTRTDYATGTQPLSVALADLNGDGHLDLATANNGGDNASVLLGLAPLVLTAVSPAAELPGTVVTLTGTGFTAGSTVSFGGTAATGVTVGSATSLTVTVPGSLAAGSAPIVVSTAGGASAALPFTALDVYTGGALDACAAAVPATASLNDGQWHYLLSPGGQVVAAYSYTGASLGNLALDVLRANPANPIRQDGGGRKYLDRNFHLSASTGRFDGRTVALRLYGLNTEQARLQYYAPTATLANLKATQYSGPNEDCDLANDVATGERRTLAAPASSPAGTTYFVAQLSVADHFSEFYLTGSSTPLPVTLTAFTATAAGPAAVRLTWATASEVNSARFEVERSADGVSFSKVDEVAAAGSSATARTYGYLDAAAPAGLSYYRLRQVDQDGTAAYSPVRTVTLGGGLALYPNPAHGGAATLSGVVPGAAVQVLDALGRVVATATADAAGTAPVGAGLAPGVYLVRSGAATVRLSVE